MIPHRRPLLRVAACLVLLGPLAGCGLKDALTPNDTQQRLTLLNSTVRRNTGGGRSIVGAVRNDSDTTYHYVQVEFKLFDSGGHGLGSTLTKTSNLGPGRTWDFAAPVRQKQAYRYTVDDVTGY